MNLKTYIVIFYFVGLIFLMILQSIKKSTIRSEGTKLIARILSNEKILCQTGWFNWDYWFYPKVEYLDEKGTKKIIHLIEYKTKDKTYHVNDKKTLILFEDEFYFSDNIVLDSSGFLLQILSILTFLLFFILCFKDVLNFLAQIAISFS